MTFISSNTLGLEKIARQYVTDLSHKQITKIYDNQRPIRNSHNIIIEDVLLNSLIS